MVSPTIKFSEGPAHQESVFINVGMLFLNGQDPTQRSSPGYTTYMCKLIWVVRLQLGRGVKYKCWCSGAQNMRLPIRNQKKIIFLNFDPGLPPVHGV